MKTVRCKYCKKKFSADEEKCPFCGTEHAVFHQGDSRLKWFEAHEYSVQNAPFVRFLARVIDILLSVLLLEILLGPLLARYMGGTTALQILIPLGLVFQILTEPFFMIRFGFTIGKKVLGIAVRDLNGELKSFSGYFIRSLLVLIWGFGFLLPGISLFTLYFSYVRIANGEATKWDEDKETLVLQKKFDFFAVALAIVLIVLGCIAIFNFSHEIFSFHDSMIRKS